MRSASRARSTASAFAPLARDQSLGRFRRCGAGLLHIGGGLRHSRARSGDGFGRHTCGKQRFALLFAFGKPREEPCPALQQSAPLAVERDAARLGAGGGLGRLLQPIFGRRRDTSGRLGPRRRVPAFVSRPRPRRAPARRVPGRVSSARSQRRQGARPRGRDRRRSAPDAAQPRPAPPSPWRVPDRAPRLHVRSAAIRPPPQTGADAEAAMPPRPRRVPARGRAPRRPPPPDRVPPLAAPPQEARPRRLPAAI